MAEPLSVKVDVWVLFLVAVGAAAVVVILANGQAKRAERQEKIESAFNDLRDVLVDWIH